MRGVKGLVCDTSLVTPEDGLIIRGIPILDLVDRTPEEAFYLLCVGELPSEADVQSIKDEFAQRSKVPDYLIDVLKAMPKTSHPMAMLTTGISALENESVFRARYDEGMKKEDYWEAALEVSLQLLAKLPSIAAAVYRIRFDKGEPIDYDPSFDWSTNYARMLGNDDPEFADLIRLYLVLHTDHEGGNVSAFTSHVVASALSDPYYAVAAGLAGLAVPALPDRDPGSLRRQSPKSRRAGRVHVGGPEQRPGCSWIRSRRFEGDRSAVHRSVRLRQGTLPR